MEIKYRSHCMMKFGQGTNLYQMFLTIVITFTTVSYIMFATDVNTKVVQTNRRAYRLLRSLTSSLTHSAVLPDDDIVADVIVQTTIRSVAKGNNHISHLVFKESVSNKNNNNTNTRVDSNSETRLRKEMEIIGKFSQNGIFNITTNTNKSYQLPLENIQDQTFNKSNAFLSQVINVKNNSTDIRLGGHLLLSEQRFNESLIKRPELKLPAMDKLLNRPNYCSLWPSGLVGRMPESSYVYQTVIPPSYLVNIHAGGRFKPSTCEPRERTAIIIPYRDREKTLQVLLRHLHTVLQRQNIEYTLYVIEMALPTQFNRGLLANIGFLTASSVSPYTCYVIHDVDALVMDDRNMYRCGRVPRHLVATSSRHGNKLPRLSYFGGVAAFTPDQYRKLNGFSNLYFGRGGEEDDMVTRIFETGMHFSRPKPVVGAYRMINHDNTTEVPQNPHKSVLLKGAAKRMKIDGVKSVSYYRLALEYKPLYTWVYIGVKEARIMEKFQDYIG